MLLGGINWKVCVYIYTKYLCIHVAVDIRSYSYCFIGLHVDESRQYYYGNFRFHFRSRWLERSLNDCLGNMQAIEEEGRVTVRQKMASDDGFTGVSLLNRLNVLYDFDVLKDMVFDTMHTLILRVALRYLQYYKECGFLTILW